MIHQWVALGVREAARTSFVTSLQLVALGVREAGLEL